MGFDGKNLLARRTPGLLRLQSRTMQNLTTLVQSAPDIRLAKVQRARAAIESGAYDVKADKISEKLFQDSLVLGA
jgi:flagellar biosynthesis anti-sigma factor FlgM